VIELSIRITYNCRKRSW